MFGHSYILCCSTALQFRCWLPLPTCCHFPPAATSHLDRVVGRVSQLGVGSVSCDLWHRRKVASLCVFFKIDSLIGHPVHSLFPTQYVMRRPTRGALAAHSRSSEMPSCRTVQFSRSFCLVVDCGMRCINLSLLVWAFVL